MIQAFKKYELLTRKREAELMREQETRRLDTPPAPTLPPPTSEPIQDELPITLPPPKANPTHPWSKAPSHPQTSEAVRKVTAAAEYISDTYNGAEMENYKWSQTLLDLDVRVPIPKGTKSKDVKVDIRSDSLRVELVRPEKKVS